jgi:hypothetical protein
MFSPTFVLKHDKSSSRFDLPRPSATTRRQNYSRYSQNCDFCSRTSGFVRLEDWSPSLALIIVSTKNHLIGQQSSNLSGTIRLLIKMSASSGTKGFCSVCGHANNEHNSYTCEAKSCRKKFKVCQTGSHPGETQGAYVLCKACPDHPYECSYVDITTIRRL